MSAATRLAAVQQTVLPGESQAEFDQLRAGFVAEFAPESELERTLVDRVIAAAWRLKRFARMESAFYAKIIDAYLAEHPEADPAEAMAELFIDKEASKKMRLFLRYQTTTQNEFDKALSELRKTISARQEAEYELELFEPAEEPVGFASQTQQFHPLPTVVPSAHAESLRL